MLKELNASLWPLLPTAMTALELEPEPEPEPAEAAGEKPLESSLHALLPLLPMATTA